jgi:hypothetical protein
MFLFLKHEFFPDILKHSSLRKYQRAYLLFMGLYRFALSAGFGDHIYIKKTSLFSPFLSDFSCSFSATKIGFKVELSPTDGSAVLVRSSFVLTNAVLKLGL